MISVEHVNEFILNNDLPIEKVEVGDEPLITIFEVLQYQQKQIEDLKFEVMLLKDN